MGTSKGQRMLDNQGKEANSSYEKIGFPEIEWF